MSNIWPMSDVKGSPECAAVCSETAVLTVSEVFAST